jgi:succinyl-diaminopimelate desuccinylase
VCMPTSSDAADHLLRCVRRERLLSYAQRLIAAPSPTGQAGPALDALAEILQSEGFRVERIDATHPGAPAVVARLVGAGPGPTLQFDGHLDTVHLPFVPPRIEGDLLTGTGSSDMKGGTAAALEAFLAVRDSGGLSAGSILLTAHDLHEAPWGFGQQLDAMIRDGVMGDAVLIPEPLSDRLPVVGRGQACWRIAVRRRSPSAHEVMRPPDEPDVIGVSCELVTRFRDLDRRLATMAASVAGRASVFVGQIHGGEIYNGSPQECWLEGTRRWLPGTPRGEVETEFRQIVETLGRESGATIRLDYELVRDSFTLDAANPFVAYFQQAYKATSGQELPTGPKPFVDDGNSFTSLGQIPAITHGPRAGGQHTIQEWASIDDLLRVARCYALTALEYCQGTRPETVAAV